MTQRATTCGHYPVLGWQHHDSGNSAAYLYTSTHLEVIEYPGKFSGPPCCPGSQGAPTVLLVKTDLLSGLEGPGSSALPSLADPYLLSMVQEPHISSRLIRSPRPVLAPMGHGPTYCCHPSSARYIQGLEGEVRALPALSGSQTAPKLAAMLPCCSQLTSKPHVGPWLSMAGHSPAHFLLSPGTQSPHLPSPPDPALVTDQGYEDFFRWVQLMFTTYPEGINDSVGIIS